MSLMSQRSVEHELELAMQLHQTGRLADAQAAYQCVLMLSPNHPDALHSLGVVMAQTNHADRGEALILSAIRLRPDVAQYHNNLGTVLRDLGRMQEAAVAYRRSIELDPNDAAPFVNLGKLLHEFDPHAAIAACRRALELKPDDAEVYWHLGHALIAASLYDQSEIAFRNLVRLMPTMAAAHMGLGYSLFRQGGVEVAFAHFEQGIWLDPMRGVNSSIIVYSSLFHPEYGPRQLHDIACAWAQRHSSLLQCSPQPLHANGCSAGRRLKIGYVSPDFRSHVMGHLFAPILEHHDRMKFEVHCFASVKKPDQLTSQLILSADKWHDVSRLSDFEFAGLVRREQIDILVDLAVHTAGNRLLAFSLKPAPVQITFLAYYGTTGLKQIDYVLCDRYFAPDEGDADCFTEQRMRLPGSYWCYRPHRLSPDVGTLPVNYNGYITFGCLNSDTKVNAAVLKLWAKILLLVPKAKLRFLTDEGATRQRISHSMLQHGVESNRIEFVSRQAHADFLGLHRQIDIALDPFPYGGGNTTCDALWMGVPVITLVGKTGVSRAGFSVLSNVGVEELVAHTHEEYIQLAADLATDLPRLELLRLTLRHRMKNSPVMDEQGYVTGLESAYRTMWKTWCEAMA